MQLMNRIAILCVSLSLTFSSCDPAALQQVLDTLGTGELTNGEISSGLKQALEFGIGKGSDQLSQRNGYFKSAYKILLPEEAMIFFSLLTFFYSATLISLPLHLSDPSCHAPPNIALRRKDQSISFKSVQP